LNRLSSDLRKVFEASAVEGIPTDEAALQLAETRLEAGRSQAGSATVRQYPAISHPT
jgi:hypothetical protein